MNMKRKSQMVLIFAALLSVSACSTARTNHETASIDAMNIDELLSDRAIAQVQIGGELLVKLIGSVSSTTEKQAILRLIEQSAQTQGISVIKGLQLNLNNVGTAFTESESASIVKALSRSKPNLFARRGTNTLVAEADAALTKAAAAQKSLNATQNLGSNIDLGNKQTLSTVKNLHYGFNKDARYVKTYIKIKRLTGLDYWNQATCTTFKKLDAKAASNLLILGESQAVVAGQVSQITAGQSAERVGACMIKKGSAQALNDIMTVLHVPANEALQTLELAVAPCHLFPESYAGSARALVESNRGAIPAVSQVSCN
jgi:hypothetical protein